MAKSNVYTFPRAKKPLPQIADHRRTIRNLLCGLRENVADPDHDLEPELNELLCLAQIALLEEALAACGVLS